MIIPGSQFKVLAQIAQAGYVPFAVAHLEMYDPPLAQAAGKIGLEQLARQGYAAAVRYEFTTDRTLQLYLELMMSLGSGYDTDPQFGWLHPYLQPTSSMKTTERARLLHHHAVSYLERAYGQHREHAATALQRASQITLGHLAQLGKTIASQPLALVEWLHPQRVDFMSAAAVQVLVASAQKDAVECRLPPEEGSVLLFLLKFTFGHDVLSDPLYPWLKRQLPLDESATDQARLEYMASRSRTYLTIMQRVLATAKN